MRLAYASYRKYLSARPNERLADRVLGAFTNDQLFFINWAQLTINFPAWETFYPSYNTHHPAELRIRLTAANFPAFANAFRCKLNSTMNPIERCPIFKSDNETDT
ncbi:unnamed protein product [Bursaphelenchus xylophilus]|uniref:(pine wood nematode) hypothetical protein n=1 Tax=Bursaphelenchus xylophilus TaxID=6326 RepID=A0A1I7RX98_BURXY|nr:unnamed protein product [Bursaphelenchus xylophilus]CAG9121462.1 unnamed protein product [Bursaphelenchus xylophilus]